MCDHIWSKEAPSAVTKSVISRDIQSVSSSFEVGVSVAAEVGRAWRRMLLRRVEFEQAFEVIEEAAEEGREWRRLCREAKSRLRRVRLRDWRSEEFVIAIVRGRRVEVGKSVKAFGWGGVN